MKHEKNALLTLFGVIAIPGAIALTQIEAVKDAVINAANELSGATQETAELLDTRPQETKTTLERYQEPSNN